MIHHPPVELQSRSSCLLALSEGIVSFGVEQSAQWINAVWLCTAAQDFLVTSVSVDRAGKFEVFSLSVQTPVENFRAPINLSPWPFQKWQIDVLERRDWLSNPEEWPRGYDIPSKLHPGELPLGTEYTCWVAPGLLFTSDQGRRLLVATDDFPCALKVSTEPDVIENYIGPCRTIPLLEYAVRLKA